MTQRSLDDAFFVIGDIAVTPTTIVNLKAAAAPYSKVVRVTSEGVYATRRTNNSTSYVRIDAAGTATEQSYAATDDQIPVATVKGLTYMLTTKLGSEQLYALPATATPTAEPSGSAS